MVTGVRRLVLLLLVTGLLLYAWPAATLAYAAGVLGHIGLGLALLVLAAARARALWRRLSPPAAAGLLLLAASGLAGLALVVTGATRPYRWLLWVHIGSGAASALLVLGDWLHARLAPPLPRRALGAALAYGSLMLTFAAAAAAAWTTREVRWRRAYVITNPAMPPASMDEEGDGPSGPFFPSSARTTDGKPIRADFFMDSQACQRCHADIYEQWFSSMHHFSSFNNQWYRKSVEYMQDVVGTRPSKWCGGCHDPAVLFSGLMDTPIKEIIDRPESQAGLGCTACHAIVAVDSTMGQGGFTLEYPTLSDLAASENFIVRRLHDFLVYTNPEPHRRAFLKPFMRYQSPEFCSTCHKVHLDVPVNHYRWIRGFNDYDNWQASGVSGQGARSFYYPPKAQVCVDCHMPLVPSRDAGNKGGFVRSHRFPAANTAVPLANQDVVQLETSKRFLQNDIVSVDIFALSPARPVAGGEALPSTELATTFAVGEEAEPAIPTGVVTEVFPVTAPLDRAGAAVRRGDTVRVDVVVRTKKLGHFFPGGTVDAFDVWVELKATDDRGQVLFWSGVVEDNGRGPVEKGAHFYRSVLVDAHGNRINKRNAWAARAVVYVRLIPPGAADTVHYRLHVPETAGDRIRLEAKLHYRKFEWWNTQFAFAGVPDPAFPGRFSPHFDDRRFLFTGDTSRVSGRLKYVPDLPIITLATDEVTLGVLPASAPPPAPKVVLAREDWVRWNDYGIGLLLQGDLKGAEAAFTRVTEIDPKNPDGWVNIGRARVQEGDLAGAKRVLERALALAPDLARAHYFLGRVLRGEGRLQEAADRFRRVLVQYPRDRVVRNDLGRTLFLMRRYREAIREFERTLSVDPEDLTAHYNLMLSYNGLGDEARAREHEKRYLRFKADESAQAITGPYRRANPEDNNERQAIHEHGSVPLPTHRPLRLTSTSTASPTPTNGRAPAARPAAGAGGGH
ncbi:MAG TPA: tetratricopeptide repeat protein, partial [Vicinamibacterales bacterium]|nr:tetratricopeptide repeat protein [Vicinamibacterales bacterium]